MTSADQLEGLDLASLDRYLRSLGLGRAGELRGEFISGGRSNLTFRVFDDATSCGAGMEDGLNHGLNPAPSPCPCPLPCPCPYSSPLPC